MEKVDRQTPSGNEAVVAISTVSKHKKIPNKKVLGFVAVLVILICVIIGLGLQVAHKNSTRINQARITGYFHTNSCNEQALKATNSEKPDPKQIKASVALLSFRASCLNRLGHYQLALPVYQQLKDYYVMEHDSNMASIVDNEIQGVQSNVNYYNQHGGSK